MREHFRLYQAGGIDKLKETHFCQPESELQAYTSTLEAHFREHPPATLKEAQDEIERLTGVRRCETQVRHFLLRLGMRCRKVGMISSKADPAVQTNYLAEIIEPRLAEAHAGNRERV
jgi:transposase